MAEHGKQIEPDESAWLNVRGSDIFKGWDPAPESPWLLGQIGTGSDGEAVFGMGYLMYELPINPLEGIVRAGEVALGGLIDEVKKNVHEGKIAMQEGSTSTRNQSKVSVLQNLALYHREGHMSGLRKAMEETRTNFLTTLLEKSSSKAGKLNPIHLVYQVAAVLEASGNNNELRNQLHGVLEESEFWKENRPNSNGLKIPGLNEKELGDDLLFKGATLAQLPTPTPSRLDKMYTAWRADRAGSTYKRAMRYMGSPHR